MINDIVKNLEKGKHLLENISHEHYIDKSIPPYYSSVGGHIRHILDLFNCIFKGIDSKEINFINRDRNINVETIPSYGLAYFDTIIDQLLSLPIALLDEPVLVIDNLGTKNCTVKSTVGAILAQGQSHAIHHFATINYMIHVLGVTFSDNDFGMNPTTPKDQLQRN